MKSILKYLLFKQNVLLQKFKIEDFRESDIDPLDAIYVSKGAKVLLSIPIDKCRTQLWHTLEESKNPFVKTLVDYDRLGVSDYNKSAVKTYYDTYQPKNAAEVLRLMDNKKMEEVATVAYLLPWQNHEEDEVLQVRRRDALNENRNAGKVLDLTYGYTDFGPVSLEKGEIEMLRLKGIYDSIQKNGYKESLHLEDGGIGGYFLVDNKEWCFIIGSGKHRAYALSAMGYKTIPVVLDLNFGIVKRSSDIPFWKHVKNGNFTIKETQGLIKEIIGINQ